MTHLLPSSLLLELSMDYSDFDAYSSSHYIADDDSSFSESTTAHSTIDTLDHSPKRNSLIFSGAFIHLLSKQKSTYSLQKLLAKASTEEIDFVVQHLHGKMVQIMQDSYGNYFFNDLFKQTNKAQRLAIVSEIINCLPKIAISQYGTHPIQTLISTTKEHYHQEHSLIIDAMLANPRGIIDMSLNQHGTHVIQKMLSSTNYFQCLLPIILANFLQLTLDLNGVCVIKTLMQVADLSLIQWILMQFTIHFDTIANDSYGNYAIQHALKIWWNKAFLLNLKGLIIMKYDQMAMSKSASHIAEVFLNQMNHDERQVFIYDLLFKGKLKTISLCKYGYGVYVINLILRFVTLNERDFIIRTMQFQLNSNAMAKEGFISSSS